MLKNLKIIVSGTDTSVGKTFFCVMLGKFFQSQKIDFAVYKPFATGRKTTNQQKIEIEDIHIYKKYLRLKLNTNLFVYKTFNFPNAPTVASIMDRKTLLPQDFDGAIKLYKTMAKKHKIIIIEGIGGLLVPITFHKLFIDFIKAVKLPVILITTNKLGTINHTLLSTKILEHNKIPYIIVFNKIDKNKSEEENRAVLSEIKYYINSKHLIEFPYLSKLNLKILSTKIFPALSEFYNHTHSFFLQT